ncbi:MAG: pullulanase-associated domain-containing protein, partial [Elusimicrobiota bacterium]
MTLNIYAQNELIVHYNRLKGDYKGWNLWVWNAQDNKEGFEVVPAGTDGYGAVFKFNLKLFNLEGRAIGILPRYKKWESKDGTDRVYQKSAPGRIYIAEGDPRVYLASPAISTGIVSALLESENKVKVIFNRFVDLPYVLKQDFYAAKDSEILRPLRAGFAGDTAYGRAAVLTFDNLGAVDYRALNSGLWRVHSKDMKPAVLELGNAVYGDDFKSDKEMGLRVSGGKTFIRVFAPFAVKAEALFYSAPADNSPAIYPLAPKEKGLWEAEIDADLTGKYWKLRASQKSSASEGVDPYASCVTAHDGLAFVEFDNSPVAPGPVFDLSEAVLYEMHIRDFTIDGFSGAEHKGKYLALAETGTVHPEYRGVKTGIDHLSELGVNAVHILPFQDFENDESSPTYNWGY